MIEIKLCGLKEPSHIEAAFSLGIKYLGFVFFDKSPRFLRNDSAKSLISLTPPGIIKVGLVVNPSDECLNSISGLNLDMIQLHGSESIDRVKEIKSKFNFSLIKAIGIKEKKDLDLVERYSEVADHLLIDAKPSSNTSLPGGNGIKFDWTILEKKSWSFPWFLAGGLNANNITEALRMTKAKKVDLSSGVEDSNGRKSINKITSFVKKIKKYEGNINVR
jgi:phosphoribosylanthranilate isomerase